EIEDAELFETLLTQNFEKKIRIRVPQRGDNAKLAELAEKNAREEAERITTREEKQRGTIRLLQQMLGTEHALRRIESYDISNLSGTDIVASMVVFGDGKPLRTAYRHFKLEGLENQDDYASMRQVLRRRFTHFLAGDKGFEIPPDLLLIDGGVNHARAVLQELRPMGIRIPIFGMVKDDRHRTRALVTPEGEEIGIAGQQSVFALIGTIQEETHRFAITYNRKLRSRRVKGSLLDQIPGIGEKRRAELLKRFKTVTAVKEASLQELQLVLTKDAAMAVYTFFHQEDKS
ncbi:MAG: excinuclease ABC subunit UvrC, partial [Oscillospiraceae bacterium]|nr:excinuclease ABC subunit UvrC [Oscillospiraceae bacterium]